mgnify:CR=1 FL=1|tara:strand:+ start:9397 stop:10326 length:930 start_codon:yes stop_codon:yes gene_type:complete
MGFLDNSGDIILDAVLTDTGRFRLAKGDGSFKITKFALGDDEIDYSKYDKNHPSGSAYYDLDIMQTPVFEAFTNNASSMKSRLTSMARNNLLYLPIIKINEQNPENARYAVNNSFLVAVDQTTETQLFNDGTTNTSGILQGQTLTKGNFILLEQGLDTTEIPDSVTIDSDLVESQYIIEIDNRFGKVATTKNSSIANPSYIDDDNIASYFFSLSQNNDYVMDSWTGKINPDKNTQANVKGIRGPKGTRFEFMIASSLDLATSTYLFETLGGSGYPIGSNNYRFIDSNIRIIGGTTGYTLDIPIRYIKAQ